MDKDSKKDCVSNFSHAVLTLLDFLTFEDGADRLSRNVSKELPLYAAYPRRVQNSHDNLAIHAFVWLCMVRLRAIQFSAPYMK